MKQQIALLIITLAFVPAVIAQRKTELRHCAKAKCTNQEIRRLGIIPPLRPLQPCVMFKHPVYWREELKHQAPRVEVPADTRHRQDVCGPQHDRVSAGSKGCFCP